MHFSFYNVYDHLPLPIWAKKLRGSIISVTLILNKMSAMGEFPMPSILQIYIEKETAYYIIQDLELNTFQYSASALQLKAMAGSLKLMKHPMYISYVKTRSLMTK